MILGPTRLAAACAAGVLALGLAGCGGSTSAPSATAPSAPATGSSTSSPSSTTDESTAAAAPAVSKVSANTASEDEIAGALESAGVSNPERWAEEVVEYRPYPADDPDLGKLREKLAKYNPGQETTDKIVSALEP
ncbi:hypothetical protein [Pseudonocardia zijingensis]|uniref:Lipoprotein n=1 Tax=Pseudonocardia zijingensis TaxID=153376 RepID=A0ABN1P3X8_9PSEU